jgi:hypothetical protein
MLDYSCTSTAIQNALKNLGPARYVFDAISEHGSHAYYLSALSKESARVTHLLPIDSKNFPNHVMGIKTWVGLVHAEPPVDSEEVKAGVGPFSWKQFGQIYTRLLTLGLSQRRFTNHPYTIIHGGLNGVERGLRDLKDGKVSATKFLSSSMRRCSSMVIGKIMPGDSL